VSEQHLSSFVGKMSWDERLDLIRKTFPSTHGATYGGETWWKKAFDADKKFMGGILRDVLKSEQAVPGRPGPRPALDVPRALPSIDRLMGKDPTNRPYCLLPFVEAMALLINGRSLRTVARRTDLSTTQLHRLLSGEIAPTGEAMERIARGFNKNPSWFLEYRVGSIAAALVSSLTEAPDKSIGPYEALFWTGAKA
jgi:Helix-turn-helix